AGRLLRAPAVGAGSDEDLSARLSRFRARGSGDAAELARALLDAGRASDALEVASAGVRAAPSSASLLVLAGRAKLATGDLLGAEAMLLRAVRAAPQHTDALRWLGEALLARGDHARAARALERGATIDPGDAAIAGLLEKARGSGAAAPGAPTAEAAPRASQPSL